VVDIREAQETLERAQAPLSQQSLEALLGVVLRIGSCLHDSDRVVGSDSKAIYVIGPGAALLVHRINS